MTGSVPLSVAAAAMCMALSFGALVGAVVGWLAHIHHVRKELPRWARE